MATEVRLYAYDEDGNTTREKRVPAWYVTHTEFEDAQVGVYVHLADGVGLMVSEDELESIGYIRPDSNYVRLFGTDAD